MTTTADVQAWDEDTTIQLDTLEPYDADETLEFESSELQERLRRMTARVPSDAEDERPPSARAPARQVVSPRPVSAASFAAALWLQARGTLIQLWRRMQPLCARALAEAVLLVRRTSRRAAARVATLPDLRAVRALAIARGGALVQRLRATWAERPVVLRARLSPAEWLEVHALARAWGCSASEVIRRLLAAERERLTR